MLYGGGSPGLVNIQGKSHKTAHTELGFNTGNRNLKEGYLDSTGQIADSDWNYRLLGKATENDDQPHTTRYENYLVAPSVTGSRTAKRVLRLMHWRKTPRACLHPTRCRLLICARNMPTAGIMPGMSGAVSNSVSGCWATALNMSLTVAGALTRKHGTLMSTPTSAAFMPRGRGARSTSLTGLLTPRMKI